MPSSMNPFSSRCTSLLNTRTKSIEERPRHRSSSEQSFPVCGRFHRAAIWVGSGVLNAFFGSLDRCSCVVIKTKDDDDLALLLSDGNNAREGSLKRRRV
ncbi:hypothetical protein IHE45_08G018800 [Dioscorea alata]|uniref:Uncharacterized protein n=1 Tax=Dioscorea alata TaxID=55571 RepID=A0ACB7VHQ3_DIOAL|nr:hypothetical protein IHE45_08G018800 [Dioscorea alata]